MGSRCFRASVLALGACLCLILLACSPAREDTLEVPVDGSSPVRGGWLVIGVGSDPETLNPLLRHDFNSLRVLRWVFSPLLVLDNETLEPRPLIAAALPEISEDKLSYTFRLRPEVTFSDGRPLTAADVVFTMKAIKHPLVLAPHLRSNYEAVQDAIALDATTVRFELEKPYFLNTLVLGGISPLPRHHYDPGDLLADNSVAELDAFESLDPERKQRATDFATRFNGGFHRNPVGPGPFVLREPGRDVITGERIDLRHRSDYWAPDDPSLDDAWVDRIVFRIISNREAALVALKRGEVDTLELTPSQYKNNEDNESFQEKIATHVSTRGGYVYIGWNLKREIFQDARVRRALSYPVDKRNIIEKINYGLAVPVESPVFVERAEYNRTLAPYSFDPERAKALLADAGWVDTNDDGVLDREFNGERKDLRFELMAGSGFAPARDAGLAIVDSFKRVGIGASLRAIDFSIMLARASQFDYDGIMLGWVGTAGPPDLYNRFHSSQAIEGGWNRSSFKNAEADRILEAYRSEFDSEPRKELYDRLQEILYEEQPYTFLFSRKIVTAWNRRFHGVRWYRTGDTDHREWWVPEPLRKY